ncbi:hypothetical protein DTO063F5_9176 [Paecilomyces variotii]|nr:hypothetical protein DTO063F5_9176 [Paecilomyces variotii]
MLPQGSLFLLAVRSFRNRAYFNLGTLKLSNCKFTLPKTLQQRRVNTTSTTPVNSQEYIGQSGRTYKIEGVLRKETSPLLQVYPANDGNQKFILKYIQPANLTDLQGINNRLLRSGASHVRLAQDTVPEKSIFVFEYFADHLLHLAREDLPLEVKKRILKDTLRGIAELHDQDIVHTDIKADNVFIDWKRDKDGITIERVQLGDLEDAAYIPPGSHMIGKQPGNWMWRSPEAHAGGSVNKPSDIFSFALVCIYAMHKRVIFAVAEDELEEGVEPLAIVIERQLSYFADKDGLKEFLKLPGDSPWVDVFQVTWNAFSENNPRRPFSLWDGMDDDFKSLICGMTNFDPERRITAREALAHKWFEGV